jgi:hypothetical protein
MATDVSPPLPQSRRLHAEWVHKQLVWIEAVPEFAARKLPHWMDFMTCFPLALSGDEGYVTDRKSESYWGMFPKICDALGIPPPD